MEMSKLEMWSCQTTHHAPRRFLFYRICDTSPTVAQKTVRQDFFFGWERSRMSEVDLQLAAAIRVSTALTSADFGNADPLAGGGRYVTGNSLREHSGGRKGGGLIGGTLSLIRSAVGPALRKAARPGDIEMGSPRGYCDTCPSPEDEYAVSVTTCPANNDPGDTI